MEVAGAAGATTTASMIHDHTQRVTTMATKAIGEIGVTTTGSPIPALMGPRRTRCQKVAMLLRYPRSEVSILSFKLYGFIAYRDSPNRTSVL